MYTPNKKKHISPFPLQRSLGILFGVRLLFIVYSIIFRHQHGMYRNFREFPLPSASLSDVSSAKYDHFFWFLTPYPYIKKVLLIC